MKTQPLSNSAEIILASMLLEKKDQETVRACIHSYSTPRTFCQTLHWLVFRIVNGIKHIFGQSDWQKAEKIIRQNTYKVIDSWFETSERKSVTFFNVLDKKVREFAEEGASTLLSNCLLANEYNSDVTDVFKKLVVETNFFNYAKNLFKSINEELSIKRPVNQFL